MPPVTFRALFVKLRTKFCLFVDFFDQSFVRDSGAVEDEEPVTPKG
jgi:hypothetical protein